MILNTGTRTDIPAFYSKWFLNRIDEGFVISKNPYNNQMYKYNFDPKTVDVIRITIRCISIISTLRQ